MIIHHPPDTVLEQRAAKVDHESHRQSQQAQVGSHLLGMNGSESLD